MKPVTIYKNHEFSRIYKKGQNAVGSDLVTYVFRNGRKNNRIAIVAAKKVGGAVVRNRARRVIRAAFYEIKPGLSQGFDIIFVARGKTARVKMQPVLTTMRTQLKKLGVLP